MDHKKEDQNLHYFLYVDIIGIREIYFLLSLMKKTLLKFGAIFTAGLMVAYSVNTFAYTTIETNILNAVQTIKRTIFTSDGTTNGTVLVDINTGSKVFIATGALSNTNANRVLGLDTNGYVTTNVTLWSGGGTWIVDHDWYEVGTTIGPDNINDYIYTFGRVAIGIDNPLDSTLRIIGNIVFGDTGNRAGYPTWFSSVLWGMGNHVETLKSTIAGGYNNNIVADADQSFIGAGWYNTIHAWASVIGWGEYNTINNGYATAYATIAGGRNNSIMGEMSTIGGGWYHSISNSFATIAWGYQNWVNGNFGTVGGGKNNVASAYGSTIAGGDMNSVTNLWAASSILGGVENWVSNANSAIVGGRQNTVHGATSFLWGGEQNIIEWGTVNVLGGGRYNTIKQGDWNSLVWGTKNFVDGFANAIVWGSDNILRSDYSSIQGWARNSIHWAPYSSIVWGNANVMTWWVVMSFIGWWQVNIIQDSRVSIIWWWVNNTITGTSHATILGGNDNIISDTILPTSNWADQVTWSSNIVWGNNNNLDGDISSIVWGRDNILAWRWNFIGWGKDNNLHGAYSSILWGRFNTINNSYNYDYDEDMWWFGLNTIVWGWWNMIDGWSSNTIIGGGANFIYWDGNQYIYPSSNIAWGNGTQTYGWLNINISNQSTITWDSNLIIGWSVNSLIGVNNTILGGMNNTILPVVDWADSNSNYILGSVSSIYGDESMTLGRNAHAWTTGRNLMVINLDSANSFTGYGSMSMLINAPYGVGINTNEVSNGLALEVNWSIKWSYVSPNNNPGLSQIVNLMGANSQACTMTIEAGIITATTCPQ